ncbi:pYEATS domain-containing protein [Chloroflexota bacterium]
MKISFNNYAEPVEKKGEYIYFRWKVFVDEPDVILDQIKSVEYLLHPTFPKPYQVIDDRTSKFALAAAGWGEFDIAITVNFKDIHKEAVKSKYHLNLGKTRPEGS